ncbi:MAG TPA: hypothetical protein VGC41_04685 [Kofleriaceae bacterium]
MAIAIQVHDRNPKALEELILATTYGGVILDDEPAVAHLSALVERENKEGEKRRAAWHWLNSVSDGMIDRDNDWSNI